MEQDGFRDRQRRRVILLRAVLCDGRTKQAPSGPGFVPAKPDFSRPQTFCRLPDVAAVCDWRAANKGGREQFERREMVRARGVAVPFREGKVVGIRNVWSIFLI